MLTRTPRRGARAGGRLPRAAGLGLVLAALLFAGGYAAGQDAARAGAENRHVLVRQAAPLAGGVGVVTPEQVLGVDAGAVQLVDVRDREAFAFSHASGAISMPESEMAGMAGTLPTDRTLVLYCSCPDEKTSLRAARTLAGVFHVPNLVVLKGGLDAFAAAGGAVTSAASDSGVEHRGCGCDTNAPAFKLWAGNMAAEREREKDRTE